MKRNLLVLIIFLTTTTFALNLNSFTTLTANVDQTTFNQNNKLVRHQSGYILIKKPNFLKFQMNHNVLLKSKSSIAFLEPKLEQVTYFNAKKKPMFVLSEVILSMNSEVYEQYFIIKKTKYVNQFKLTPKKPLSNIDYLILSLEHGKIIQIDLYNYDSSHTIYQLSNIVIDSFIDNEKFSLSIPESYDVIK